MGSAIVGPSRRMYSRNFVLTSPTSLACWRSRSDTFSSMAAVMVTVVRSGGCLLLCLRRLFESLSEEGSWRFFFELLRSAASASWRFLRSSSCPAISCPSCVSIFSCCVSCFSNAAMICCRAAAGTWTVPLLPPTLLMAKRGMAPQRRDVQALSLEPAFGYAGGGSGELLAKRPPYQRPASAWPTRPIPP